MDLTIIIKQLQDEKNAKNIQPPYVTFSEIMDKVREGVKADLNGLVKEGTIEFHRTINDVSFNIKS